MPTHEHITPCCRQTAERIRSAMLAEVKRLKYLSSYPIGMDYADVNAVIDEVCGNDPWDDEYG